MGYLENLIIDVEKTHKGFGELVAMCQVIVKSRKMMLIVSPSGCGKSRAMELIYKQTSDAIKRDYLSSAGLKPLADKLTSFRSVFIVDDIANCKTDYNRNATISTLSSLVYSHIIQPQMMGNEYTIEDYYGSAIAGIQPVLLREIMKQSEWDASIQDKVLRYYHLKRPLIPVIGLPDVQLNYGIDFEKVDDFELDYDKGKQLVKLANYQWSVARVKEHLTDMLKAIASLERRSVVIDDDYVMLTRLLRNMAIENVVVRKDQLEGERQLDNNLLALLAEYYSYGGQFLLGQIAIDFKLSVSQTYRIMQSQNGSWQQVSKEPTIYRPSDNLQKVLKSLDLEVKNG